MEQRFIVPTLKSITLLGQFMRPNHKKGGKARPTLEPARKAEIKPFKSEEAFWGLNQDLNVI
jgi:hypothetical protein